MNSRFIIIIILLVTNWSYCVFFVMMPFAYLYCRCKKRNVPSRSKIVSYLLNNGHFKGYIRYMDIKTGYIPSHHIRKWLYSHIWLVNVDKSSTIYYGTEIRDSFKLSIGRGSVIGDKALLDARNGIEIKRNVNISSNVSIYTEQHDHRDKDFRCNSNASFKVIINDRAWIGPNVIILPSVTIGEGAVVAAGSVVTHDVPPFTIVAGIPAKKIGNRTKDLKYNFSGKDYSPFL